jgi:uncharacterized membrane protein
VALDALAAALMSAAWIGVFAYLKNHPQLVEADADRPYFQAQRMRPWVGVILYLAAGLLACSRPWWG